jgi:hypothetical protein
VLLLVRAGIYALMSFTVTSGGARSACARARCAPAAHPGGHLRARGAQLAIGAAVGLAMAIALNLLSQGETTGGHARVVLPAVTAIILLVGLSPRGARRGAACASSRWRR